MQTLNERKTSRNFIPGKDLSLQQLSDLLWATYGINRENGKRTAPSAMNWQETEIYVCTKDACYLYEAVSHSLASVVSGDFRKNMGEQKFVGDASVVLVFVANEDKMSAMSTKEEKEFYSTIDVGYISQNVYLFAASENLGIVALGWIKREEIASVLKLKKEQKVILTQCVGYVNEK